jgi:NitT/TauT family transport system ATP-binding protein
MRGAMTDGLTVRGAVFDFLRKAGLTTVFGNPGSTELRMFAGWHDDFTYSRAMLPPRPFLSADEPAWPRWPVPRGSARGRGYLLRLLLTQRLPDQVKPVLQIEKVGHHYADHTALEDVNLEVAEGELVSIVGPSGCGKSTLLRCIAGLIRPSHGRITLNGAEITDVPDNLAVVFQDYSRSLLPWLTVRDNVALPLRRRGKAKAERRDAALAALEAVGLAGAEQKYPWQLSGGMQQRVSIARALAYQPALLLMDEPFGSVDAQTREDLEDLVLRVRKDGMTILLVTHDIDESVYVGDRVVVLDRAPGRIVADLAVGLSGTRDQITTRELPEFVHLRAEVGRLVRGQTPPAANAR